MKRLISLVIGVGLLGVACVGHTASIKLSGGGPNGSPVASATPTVPNSPAATKDPTPAPSASEDMAAITMTQPDAGERVASPVHISGTANVFEATVTARILDAQGVQIASALTQATCGTGCRGDYSVWIAYSVPSDQPGTVEVYEASAKDGSPVHVVKVAVTLTASGSTTSCGCDDSTPAILASTPDPGQRVGNPVTVSGTADVFEAQFVVRLLDEDGTVITELPVHASCGTGCVGDFSVSVGYTVDHEQPGTIWLFDYSERDGSIIDLVKIPVTLTP